MAPVLIAQLTDAQAIVGDKGYDSLRIREQIEAQDSQCVIPRKRNSVQGNDYLDRGAYRDRHLVENAFARLKQYRALACRFDKLKKHYEGVVAIACVLRRCWLRRQQQQHAWMELDDNGKSEGDTVGTEIEFRTWEASNNRCQEWPLGSHHDPCGCEWSPKKSYRALSVAQMIVLSVRSWIQ